MCRGTLQTQQMFHSFGQEIVVVEGQPHIYSPEYRAAMLAGTMGRMTP